MCIRLHSDPEIRAEHITAGIAGIIYQPKGLGESPRVIGLGDGGDLQYWLQRLQLLQLE
jgi:hypothetical protein